MVEEGAVEEGAVEGVVEEGAVEEGAVEEGVVEEGVVEWEEGVWRCVIECGLRREHGRCVVEVECGRKM